MHWHRVKLKVNSFVILVSFLVQLHCLVTTLVVALVTFLHVQFSLLSEGSGHVLLFVVLLGLVPFPLVPLVLGLVPLLLVPLLLVPLVFGFVPLVLFVPLVFGLVPLFVLLVVFEGCYEAY